MPLGRVKWVLAVSTTILIAAFAALACGGPASSGSLIPEGATLIGDINPERIKSELDIESIFDSFPFESGGPAGFAHVFSGAQGEIGAIFRDVTLVEFFGDVSEARDYFGVIVHGEFDETAVISEIEAMAGMPLRSQTYKGHEVYSEESGADRISLSVLDSGTLVVGTDNAVKASLDVLAGDRETVSNELVESLDDLGDRVFGAVVQAPSEALENQDADALSELTAGLPISLDFIDSIDTLGVAGELFNDILRVKAVMDFSSEDAAKSMKEFTDGIMALLSGFSDDPQATELLDSLAVNLDGSVLTFTVDIPKSQLGDLSGIVGGDATGIFGSDPAIASPVQPAADLGEEVPVMPSTFHVPNGQKVEYSTTPPTSGEHWADWADCGWYEQELPDERVVHNLEHGNIVVSYNLASAQEVAELKKVIEGDHRFEEWVVARPYSKIPEGTVALAGWGQLVTHHGVSPDQISQFFGAFAGLLGPERVPC